MRTTTRVICFSAALAALAVACDSSTPTRSGPFLPQSPSAFGISRIEIAGPGSVAPGQTVQFTATAYRSDGTMADITTTANWRSFTPNVLSITSTGSAT